MRAVGPGRPAGTQLPLPALITTNLFRGGLAMDALFQHTMRVERGTLFVRQGHSQSEWPNSIIFCEGTMNPALPDMCDALNTKIASIETSEPPFVRDLFAGPARYFLVLTRDRPDALQSLGLPSSRIEVRGIRDVDFSQVPGAAELFAAAAAPRVGSDYMADGD